MLGGGKRKKKKITKKPLSSGSYSSVSTMDTHRHTHPSRDTDMGTLKDTQRHTWPSRHTEALPGMYRHPHRHLQGDGDRDPDTQTHTHIHRYVRQLQPAPLTNRRQLSFLCLL